MISEGLDFASKTLGFLSELLSHIPTIDQRKKQELQKMIERQIMLEKTLQEHVQGDQMLSKVTVGLLGDIRAGEKQIEGFYEIWKEELKQKKIV